MGGFESLKIGQVDQGYWGNHTSTIDWCEENYQISPHIAEFVNTFSNIPFILLGLYGAFNFRSVGLPLRFQVLLGGLGFIGVGSFLFHMQLKWAWQMWDELAMIYVIGLCNLLVFDTLPGWEHRWGMLGVGTLVVYDLVITGVYGYLGNPIFHQISFAITQIISTIRVIYLINFSLPDSSIHPARKIISRMFFKGLGIFVLGFVLWNVDNVWCEELRVWREALGPAGMLLQFHAWWHLMTGYGSYLVMIGCTYLCIILKTDQDAYAITSSLPFLPKLEKCKPAVRLSKAEKEIKREEKEKGMSVEEKTTKQYTPKSKGEESE